jgi:hypothetical protein
MVDLLRRSHVRAFSVGAAGLTIALLALQGRMEGQGQGQGRGNQPPPSARAGAAFDPTGYWSSVITQNWRLRMVPPAKGDYIGIPISAAGKKAADGWDQAKDEAAGNQCKAYGAPGLMNLPTHLHITWQDDNTLRVDTDYGTQTRVLHFAAPQGLGALSESRGGNLTPPEPRKRSWQGNSAAVWASRRGGRGGAPSERYLRITTTDLLSGYLRKNGVPYSESASLLEYVDLFQEPNGAGIIVWTAVVDDLVNLETPYIISSQFKKEPDGSAWDPTPCSAGW